jgi:hypothetical protein
VTDYRQRFFAKSASIRAIFDFVGQKVRHCFNFMEPKPCVQIWASFQIHPMIFSYITKYSCFSIILTLASSDCLCF